MPFAANTGGSGGGGSQPGAPVVRGPFVFAYNTPNLATGIAFYTPTIGDILLDLWFEIDTAWNGTTPTGDVGTFSSGPLGLFENTGTGQAKDMTVADAALVSNDNILGHVLGGTQARTLAGLSAAITDRTAPSRFTGAAPLKVVVSTDGTVGTHPFVDDDPPALALHVVTGVNDQFVFTGGGGLGAPETFTVAPGTYTTLAQCITAMGAAIGAAHGEAFSTLVTPSVGGIGSDRILLTMVAALAGNGNTITPGTHDVAAGLGFDNPPEIFAGGSGDSPGASQGAAKLYIVTATPTAFV